MRPHCLGWDDCRDPLSAIRDPKGGMSARSTMSPPTAAQPPRRTGSRIPRHGYRRAAFMTKRWRHMPKIQAVE